MSSRFRIIFGALLKKKKKTITDSKMCFKGTFYQNVQCQIYSGSDCSDSAVTVNYSYTNQEKTADNVNTKSPKFRKTVKAVLLVSSAGEYQRKVGVFCTRPKWHE